MAEAAADGEVTGSTPLSNRVLGVKRLVARGSRHLSVLDGVCIFVPANSSGAGEHGCLRGRHI